MCGGEHHGGGEQRHNEEPPHVQEAFILWKEHHDCHQNRECGHPDRINRDASPGRDRDRHTRGTVDGGKGGTSLTRTDFASVPSVVQAFLSPWGAVTETSASIDRKDDGTSVIVTDYAKAGTVVLRLITVEGGAHHWPGGRKARLDTGKTQEIDANTEILRFFALHP